MNDIEVISKREADWLSELEDTIARGMKTFVDVGNALLEIRDNRLYRESHKTFEDYCRDKWGMSQRHANRMIEAYNVTENLGPIGPVLPTTESQARPIASLPTPEAQREVWERAVETAPEGKVTAAHVQSVANEYKRVAYYSPPVHSETPEPQPEKRQFYETTNAAQPVAVTIFSSESNEYYTPQVYIAAALELMGGIDLDPATCAAAQEHIQAAQYFTEQDDGLAQAWHGRVWLNPPYGKIGNESSQGIWGQKLISEYRAGRVTEGVLLVRAAVGYEWFELLWDELPVCFARERLSFIRADGNDEGQSKQGTAFFYVGNDRAAFAEVFGKFGRVIMPEWGGRE